MVRCAWFLVQPRLDRSKLSRCLPQRHVQSSSLGTPLGWLVPIVASARAFYSQSPDENRLTGHLDSVLEKPHRILANLLGLVLSRVAEYLHQARTIFAHGFEPLKPFRNRLVEIFRGSKCWEAREQDAQGSAVLDALSATLALI